MGIFPPSLFFSRVRFRSGQKKKTDTPRSGFLSGKRLRSILMLEEMEPRNLLSAVPAGSEFQVNTFTQGPQQTFFQSPEAVAVNSTSGDYVITWSSQNQIPGGGWDVYAQRYNAAGVPQGGEFLVNSTTANDQQYSTVAMDPNGDFVITWSGHQSGHWDVYAQRYNAAGAAQGGEFQVSPTAITGEQEFSTVAMDANGNFVITWSGNQSGHWQIYAQQYNASGVAQGSAFLVNTDTADDQQYSTVAMAPTGSYVVTWSGHQGGNWNVYAQQFSSTGVPIGAEFEVDTTTGSDQEYSTVAMDANGNFVVTWSGHQAGHWNVYAQRYNALAVAQGGQFQVNTTTGEDRMFSTVAMSSTGNFVVTWSSHNQDGSGWGIYGQQYDNTGAAQAGEFRINTYTPGDQEWSSVAMDSAGNFVVAWSSNNEDGNGWGVFAQRYTVPLLVDLPLLGGSQAINATEGVPFTGAVASFTDTDILSTAGDFSATITWGDGQVSGGTITSSGLASYVVTGTNTYAEEGGYSASVLIQDLAGASVTVNDPATVADAPLGVSAVPVTATQEVPFSGLVATFTDAAGVQATSNYTATITWGDGHTSPGTITPNGSGGFNVSGSNTYAQNGSFSVNVVVHDVGGSTAGSSSTATVADAPLTAAGVPVSAMEGFAFTGVVAGFTDPDPTAAVGSYTAVITWGDGQTSPGVIAPNGSGGFQVSGANTYAQAGSYTVNVTIKDLAGSMAMTTSTAMVQDAPLSAGATVSIGPTEGTAFTGVVAKFNDANAQASLSSFTASITWGDGNTSPGSVVADPGGGFDVTGTNTYAQAGGYNIAVSIHDSGGNSIPINSSSGVADAPLSGTAVAVSATEGAPFTGVVATFNDANSFGTVSSYTATITWGDGNVSTGTVTTKSGGGFQVSGTNTYARAGSFTVGVVIRDSGGSTISPSGSATVADAALSALGTTFTATEGTPFSGVVATFHDADPMATPGLFTATITWDDGSSSAGTVAVNGASFTVSGTHDYAAAGGYSVGVDIQDSGGSAAHASSTATIAEAAVSTTAAHFFPVEGMPYSGVVASFHDADSLSTVSFFSATITWGDGQNSSGTIVAGALPGDFNVTGTNTYAQAGNYVVRVSIRDLGGSAIPVSSVATVSDVALSATGMPVAATEGASFTGVVATFHDANALGVAGSFMANITWGDGHTSAGTVAANAGGGFDVTGTNTYAQAGSYSVNVSIRDVGGSTATAGSTATVADAALHALGATITPVEGVLFTGMVAHFTDADPLAAAGLYTASITWGDGSVSSGTIRAVSGAGFDVIANHTYVQEGASTIDVLIRDVGGSTVHATSTANVSDAALTALVAPVTATEGAPFTGVVARFHDANAFDTVGSYTATISWGDGNSSPGTITANTNGDFTVTGTNTYVEEGVYAVRVAIVDIGGSRALVTGKATVNDAALGALPQSFTATEGVPFIGRVAIFRDANSAQALDAYTATIAWGDGNSTQGTIVAHPGGGFDVSGTNTYAQAGLYSVQVTIRDIGGGSIVAVGSAHVADVPLTASAVPVATVEGTAFQGTVAMFTDANPLATAGDYTATIVWGDGHTSAGSVVAASGGGFEVTGTNTYVKDGNYAIGVLLIDTGGSTVAIRTKADVADAPLRAGVAEFSPVEGASFAGVVAKFTDANPSAITNSFTAMIDWGDGQMSQGTVAVNPDGGFAVSGSNTYAEEGGYTIRVRIRDSGGSKAAVIGNVMVADAPLQAVALPIAASEGSSVDPVIAQFSDSDPSGAANDYSAMINWGDGTTSQGTITANPSGGFLVTATKTYKEDGSYPVDVTIEDVGGHAVIAGGTAEVQEEPLSADGLTVQTVEGTAYSGLVASFRDPNPFSSPGNYTATISWGDGGSTTATVARNASGGFSVTGTYTYQSQGAYAITVTVADAQGHATAIQSAATVAPSPSGSSRTPATSAAATSSPAKATNAVLVAINQVFVPPALVTSGLSYTSDGSYSRQPSPELSASNVSSGGGSPAAEESAPLPGPKPAPAAKGPSSARAQHSAAAPAVTAPNVPSVNVQNPTVPAAPRDGAHLVKQLDSGAEFDFASLDALKQDAEGRSTAPRVVDAVFITGAIASAGYILLTSRSVFWLLSALTARPLWKQLDPLEVLFAWEKEKEKKRWKHDGDEEETLPSLIKGECPATC